MINTVVFNKQHKSFGYIQRVEQSPGYWEWLPEPPYVVRFPSVRAASGNAYYLEFIQYFNPPLKQVAGRMSLSRLQELIYYQTHAPHPHYELD